MSEEELDGLRRKRNAERARRSREKRRQEDENLKKMYAENERRIVDLERTIDALHTELRSPSSSSSVPSASNRAGFSSKGSHELHSAKGPSQNTKAGGDPFWL